MKHPRATASPRFGGRVAGCSARLPGGRAAGLFAVLAAGLGALAAAPVALADGGIRAMPTSAFVETLAINTHVNYTDGAYANVSNVADDLAWLGIRRIRDGPPGSAAPLSSYIYLAKRGVKFDFVMRPDIPASMNQIARLNAAVPGSIVAIEGFNEINNWPVPYDGLKGDAAGLAAQRAIYMQVHADPSLAGVVVYDLTGYDPKLIATRAKAADFANQHVYPQNGEQPTWNSNGDKWMAWATDGLKKFQLPLVITEFGYFSMPQAGWYMLGVDEPTQAKGVLNGYMDAAAAGVAHTYVYELLDEKPDPQNRNGEMHFGLFRNNNSPKPVAKAIHNLTSILSTQRANPVNVAAHGVLGYTLAGLPVSGNSLLLQKEDGSFLLALWNEVPIWNRAEGAPASSSPVNVEIDFGATASRVDLYDPTVSATPLASRRDLRRLTMAVPDHPVLIEVTLADAQRN